MDRLITIYLISFTFDHPVAMLMLKAKADPNVVCRRTNLAGQNMDSAAFGGQPVMVRLTSAGNYLTMEQGHDTPW